MVAGRFALRFATALLVFSWYLITLLPPISRSAEPRWDARLGPPGVHGGDWQIDPFSNPPTLTETTAVYATLRHGTDLYIGGVFASAGGVAANNIVRLNTITGVWSALGAGVNGRVSALALHGNSLYVAGSFSNAGSLATVRIAKWDLLAQNWSALGAGLGNPAFADNQVLALATDSSGQLYAGGRFETSDSLMLNNLARWDGTRWNALGSGANNVVTSLAAAPDDQIYAGGFFTTAGGVAARRIARWNGQRWATLGNGISEDDGAIRALTFSGNDLIAAGIFQQIGDVTTRHIARWDGTNWHALGSVPSSVSGINALHFNATALFAAADGQLLRWNGTNWSVAGPPVAGAISTLVNDGNSGVMVGGQFSSAGGIAANHIANWNGTNWASIAPGAEQRGLNNRVSALAISDDQLVAGGAFTQAHDLRLGNLARWNRTSNTWSRLSGFGVLSVPGEVKALAFHNNDLFVAGTFRKVGGQQTEIEARGIAQWNRQSDTWVSLAGGLGEPGGEPSVAALALGPDGSLYAGGSFRSANGLSLNHIARWDGKIWSALGSGVVGGSGDIVRALAFWNGNLYAGGSFTSAGGQLANGLARWDGTNWQAVPGFAGVVETLLPTNTGLVVGGRFTVAGSASIARWDGNAWHGYGTGVRNPFAPAAEASIYALVEQNGVLYVGGDFTQAGNSEVFGVARWRAGFWQGLDSGVSGGGALLGTAVAALASDGQRIYLGGNFTAAGGLPSAYFAVYTPTADQELIYMPYVLR
jgi:hypothetical protein